MEPSGKWSTPGDTAAGEPASGQFTPATDDSDDLIEIREPSYPVVKREQASADSALLQTPAHSQGPPNLSPVNPPSSNKRPAAVIDLTGSDDDEDESPVRPAKRPTINAERQEFRSLYRDSDLLNGRRYAL